MNENYQLITNQVKQLSFDEINKLKAHLSIEESLMIKKGMTSNDPEEIMKAYSYFNETKQLNNQGDQKSYLMDPWSFTQSLGYKDKATSLSYNLLRKMARTPVINSIIGTRLEQITSFAQPVTDKNQIGFMIRKKSFGQKPEDVKLNDEDRRNIDFLTQFILDCGVEQNKWHGDDFETFLRKHYNDSLTLDQGTFECVYNRKGNKILEFLATDGATYRIADTHSQTDGEQVNGYFPSYVQIYNSEAIQDFYPWELCFNVRNPQTDVRLNGYGVSELEILINQITSMLFADQYNSNFFSKGSSPKGILKVSGNINEDRLSEFRQSWMATVAGVQNSHKTPIINSDKMEWIDLQKTNRDMEFSKWQEFLIKVSCAVFKIDPTEMGFASGAADTKPLFEGNNEARLKYSKDKGLRPLLRNGQARVNKYLIRPQTNEYEFVFCGLDEDDADKEMDRDVKAVGSFMGLKEVRKKRNLPDEIDPDDVILNQVWMANKQMSMNGDPESNQAILDEYNSQEGDMKNKSVDPFVESFNNYLEQLKES